MDPKQTPSAPAAPETVSPSQAASPLLGTPPGTALREPHIVIVGGGFAGLYTAKALRHAPAQITLLDRRNYHLFQPLLYQVATGALSPANIAAPLRSVLRRARNCQVLMGEVTGFDIPGKAVLLGNERIPFDSLIVAAGATNNYFGKPEWEEHAPGLKSIEEATEIRRRVL